MDDIETLTAFLGWCTLINFALLSIAALTIVALRDTIVAIHGRMFGIGADELVRAYFQYLAQYKIAIFVLNLVPYVALKIVR